MASRLLHATTSEDTGISQSDLIDLETGRVTQTEDETLDHPTSDSHKVKLTLWRFLNALVLLGLATAKGVLAFQDNPNPSWPISCVVYTVRYVTCIPNLVYALLILCRIVLLNDPFPRPYIMFTVCLGPLSGL